MKTKEISSSVSKTLQKKWSEKKMLLIEEDEISILLIKEILGDTGIKIVSCLSFEEAFNEIDKQREFDIIILNYSLFKDLSNNLLTQIRKYQPLVPVIITSSIPFQMLDHKYLYINGSIKQLLLKPLQVEELVQTIETYII